GFWFRWAWFQYLATSDSWLSSLGPESGHTERESPRFEQSAGIATVLFHPDFNRRLRNCTESADPSSSSNALAKKALAGLGLSLRELRPFTAGGEFRPALRTSAVRNERPGRNNDETPATGQAALAWEPAWPHAGNGRLRLSADSKSASG